MLTLKTEHKEEKGDQYRRKSKVTNETNTVENINKNSKNFKNMQLPRYFYLQIENPLGRYFQVRSNHYQAPQCIQKTYIPVS